MIEQKKQCIGLKIFVAAISILTLTNCNSPSPNSNIGMQSVLTESLRLLKASENLNSISQQEWSHEILGVNRINAEKIIVVTHSNYEGNYCNACSGYLSVFEYSSRNGIIEFQRMDVGSIFVHNDFIYVNYQVVDITKDKYGVLIEKRNSTMDGESIIVSLHCFADDKIETVLYDDYIFATNDVIDINLMTDVNHRDNSIEIIEIRKYRNGQRRCNSIDFEYDGEKYKRVH